MNPSLTIETRIYNTADKSTPIRTLHREVDVGQFENFSQAELEAIAIGREFDAVLIDEIVKKKKRSRWFLFFRKIFNWQRMAGGQSASAGSPISPPTPDRG